jgi:serine-type D-Ala-D-Ala carboxypeptidase (penicillin-binding protein 5/6)
MAPRTPTRRRITVRPALAALLALVLGAGPLGTPPVGAAPGQEPTTTTVAPDGTTSTTLPGAAAPPAGADVIGPVPAGTITAREYIVVDADTGEIIAAQDEHVAVLAASTVKTMTALLAIDELGPDATVTVPAEATGVACNCLEGFEAGQTWRVRDLLGGLLIGSNNDVAYALAIGISGSVEGFAVEATALGARLGTTDSSFTDPAGLDGAEGYRGGTLVSAHDLAILARNLLAVPDLAEIVGNRTAVLTRPDGTTMTVESSNQLVGGGYEGAIGVKTGFTNAARASLVAAATRGGRTIVTVVLGAEETFDLTSRLLDLGFATPPGSGVGEYLPSVRMGPAAAPFDGSSLVLAAATSAEQTSSDGGGGGGGGGGVPVRMIVIVVLVLLLVLVVVRRRAVVRRRRARARQRQFHDARRRYLRTAEPDPEGPTVRPKALRQDR